MDGFYYLHKNGSLIYRRNLDGIEGDLDESDLVVAYWPIVLSDRATAWDVLVEALALGANKERIAELRGKWGCTDSDGAEYAERRGVKLVLRVFDQRWVARWKENPGDLEDYGDGETVLEAIARLVVRTSRGVSGGRHIPDAIRDRHRPAADGGMLS